ncbi:MAG: hypothetical protein KDA96_23735, partial [Planctomycetaceae bacterium]|nr:hypothetical protein [Planctomycetaceae bacterium]
QHDSAIQLLDILFRQDHTATLYSACVREFMPTVAVKPEILRWAVLRSGLPMEDLQEKHPRLNDWLEGIRQPALRQLEQFARTTILRDHQG